MHGVPCACALHCTMLGEHDTAHLTGSCSRGVGLPAGTLLRQEGHDIRKGRSLQQHRHGQPCEHGPIDYRILALFCVNPCTFFLPFSCFIVQFLYRLLGLSSMRACQGITSGMTRHDSRKGVPCSSTGLVSPASSTACRACNLRLGLHDPVARTQGFGNFGPNPESPKSRALQAGAVSAVQLSQDPFCSSLAL